MLGLSPELLLARIFTLIIAFTVHEFAHAWTADQLGDDTPRLAGRLTLNPLAHLDLLGSLMLGLVSISSSVLAVFVADFIFLNLVLFFFNLIPIFPLDGEKVLTYFLPPSGQAFLAQVRPYGPILLAVLVILSSRSGLDLLDLLVRGPALRISSFLVS